MDVPVTVKAVVRARFGLPEREDDAIVTVPAQSGATFEITSLGQSRVDEEDTHPQLRVNGRNDEISEEDAPLLQSFKSSETVESSNEEDGYARLSAAVKDPSHVKCARASVAPKNPFSEEEMNVRQALLTFFRQNAFSDYLATSRRVKRLQKAKLSSSRPATCCRACTVCCGTFCTAFTACVFGGTHASSKQTPPPSVHTMDRTRPGVLPLTPPDLHHSDDLNRATKEGCTEEDRKVLHREFILQRFHRLVRSRYWLNDEIPEEKLCPQDSLRFCRVISPYNNGRGHGSAFLQRELGEDGVQRWFLYTVRHNLAPRETPQSTVPRLLLVVLDHGANPHWNFLVRIDGPPSFGKDDLDFLRQELRDDNVTPDFSAIIQESKEWHRGLCTAIIEQLKCSRFHDRELFGCAIGYSSTSASLCLTYLWDRRRISNRVCRVLFVSFEGNSGGAVLKLVPDVNGGHLEVDGVIEAGESYPDAMKIDGWYVTLHSLEVNCTTYAEIGHQRKMVEKIKAWLQDCIVRVDVAAMLSIKPIAA